MNEALKLPTTVEHTKEATPQALLALFQTHFATIDSRGDEEMKATADEIKRLIFKLLQAEGNFGNEITYDDWEKSTFPKSNEVTLLGFATENGLISESEHSDLLKTCLGKLITASTSYVGSSPDRHSLLNEARALQKQENLTQADFDTMSERLLYPFRGPQSVPKHSQNINDVA